MRARAHRTIWTNAAVSALLVVGVGCSSTDTPLQIGIKRTAVNLAFKDEALPAKPPDIRTVFQQIDVPVPALPVVDFDRLPAFKQLPPLPKFELCPKAEPDAHPADPVTLQIVKRPVAGRYVYVNEGTFKIVTAIGELQLPYPPIVRKEVKNVVDVPLTDPIGRITETAVQYDVLLRLGELMNLATYQLRSDGVYLMKLERGAAGVTRSFTPHQPMAVYKFGSEATEWTSPGLDINTRVAMLVQGKIEKRDIVDLCGEVVDTYRASSRERVATVDGDYQAQTNDEDPNAYWFATHTGPLPVQEHIHLTETILVTTDAGAKIPVTLEWNYTSKLRSLKPLP